jgi:hypothetical protein
MEDGRRAGASDEVISEEAKAIQGSLRIFDNAITDEFCDVLLETFKLHLDEKEHKDNFVQFNYSDIYEEEDLHKNLISFIGTLHEHYMQALNLPLGIFHKEGIEKLRIKKVLPPEKESLVNIDVRDTTSSIRALGFMFFLSNSERKVQFFRQGVGIQPQKGRVIVYPPHWEYPYNISQGEDDVFILQTYLHYGTEKA